MQCRVNYTLIEKRIEYRENFNIGADITEKWHFRGDYIKTTCLHDKLLLDYKETDDCINTLFNTFQISESDWMCRRLNLNQHWGPYKWIKVICLKMSFLWNFISFPCGFWILRWFCFGQPKTMCRNLSSMGCYSYRMSK